MTNLLPGVRSGAQHGVNDVTPLLHAQGGTGNRLEPATGHSYIAPPAGLRCELSAVNKAVPLTLYWLPGVLSRVEWLAIALQQPALGGYNQYP